MPLLPGTLVKMLGDGTFITLASDGRYVGRTSLNSGYFRDYQVTFLPTGQMMTVDGINVEFYDNNLVHVNGIAGGQVYYWVSSNLVDKFYYSVIQGTTTQRIVTVNGDGTFVAFIDLATPSTGQGLGLGNDNFIFAINPLGTIIYCSGSTTIGGLNNPVNDFGRWTVFRYNALTGAQSTFLAQYSYPLVVQDIKVMANTNILVLVSGRYPTGSNMLLQVDMYNTAGTLLHSYQFNDVYAQGYSAGSINIGFDNNSFWLISPAFTSVNFTPPMLTDHVIYQINVADGAILQSFSCPIVLNVDPLNHSQNPFFIVPSYPLTFGQLIVTKVVNAVRRSPNSGQAVKAFQFYTQGGLAPTSFTLINGQTIIFSNVTPGIYSFYEEAEAGWIISYDISNGSFIESLVVGNGEIVTVTVVNAVKSGFASGLYVMAEGRTADKVYATIEGSPPSNVVETEVKIPDPYVLTAYISDED